MKQTKHFGTLILSIIIFASHLHAQKKNIPTNHFIIEGKVKNPTTISLKDLPGYTTYSIDTVVITNHLHEKKRTLHNVKGILLKDILSKVEIEEEAPKLLSEFYFVCIASDNYKVVFSWNELFNNDLGKAIYVITESDGKGIALLEDRIAIISPGDYTTGRRYVQCLQKISIERVN